MVINFSLRLEGDPLLYQKLEDFDFNSGYDLEEIENKMTELMTESQGIGISANQVGFDRRVIVIWPKAHKEIDKPFALFNPKIIKTSAGNNNDIEGCLSFPDLYIKIDRADEVTVEYIDKHKKSCIITLNGYDARCVQHEIDHLNGTCFISRVSSLKLEMARKRQRKIKNGRTK
jgi:peptide deformylase